MKRQREGLKGRWRSVRRLRRSSKSYGKALEGDCEMLNVNGKALKSDAEALNGWGGTFKGDEMALAHFRRRKPEINLCYVTSLKIH